MRALKDQAALPSEKVGKEGVCPCAQFWIQPGHPCEEKIRREKNVRWFTAKP
jgi:hypothetical protein